MLTAEDIKEVLDKFAKLEELRAQKKGSGGARGVSCFSYLRFAINT
jgi:hypothetical protein